MKGQIRDMRPSVSTGVTSPSACKKTIAPSPRSWLASGQEVMIGGMLLGGGPFFAKTGHLIKLGGGGKQSTKYRNLLAHLLHRGLGSRQEGKALVYIMKIEEVNVEVDLDGASDNFWTRIASFVYSGASSTYFVKVQPSGTMYC